MFHAILLCLAILGDGGKPAVPTAADRAAYETARNKAGNTAAAQVQLALWCEAHGLAPERTKHLELAVSLDPSNALARGLLGLVAYEGKWARPEQIEKDIQADPNFQALFREYLDRRVRTPAKKVDAQLHLADWCLEKGLKDEAMAHYHLVTQLDPSRDIAWIRLGYKKQKDRWFKPDGPGRAEARRRPPEAGRNAVETQLEKLRDAIESSVESRRLKAENELYKITDPRAVPLIARILGSGGEHSQIVAVELLSQIDGPAASFWLAALAVDKQSPAVADHARRALAQRDPREIIGWLVNLIHKPFKYELGAARRARQSFVAQG